MEQSDFLKLAVEVLERLQIPYFLVGSYASSIWGEPRFTHDIDVVVVLSLDDVAKLCAEFPAPEFYVSESAAKEAIQFRKQFNVIHPTSANKIDLIAFRGDEWSQQELARRSVRELAPGFTAQVASPEDEIISKMRYYQEGGIEKHLRDITGILAVQGKRIDREYVTLWAQHFGVTDIWQAVQDRLNRPATP